ncbi:MAG: YebC/PmpR family DNA-binding transcriptional regulator [Bacillota bacterium]
MSGHSKWSKIKRGKEKTDAARSKAFTKITREIITAAGEGGGDPDHNFRLRLVIQKARSVNMPNDNIMRAIKRGIGEAKQSAYESVVYEGYGPGGMAVLVEVLTDNRNRTAGEVRHIFAKNGGNLGETNCVSWMFKRKGILVVELDENSNSEDKITEMIMEVDAEDFLVENGVMEIYTDPASFERVKSGLEGKGLIFSSAELAMVPLNTINLDGDALKNAVALVEGLEENDDVQNVYTNLDMPES